MLAENNGADQRRINWPRLLIASSMGIITFLMVTSLLENNRDNVTSDPSADQANSHSSGVHAAEFVS